MIHLIAYTDGANMPHHDFKHAGAAAIVQVMCPGTITHIFEWGRYLGSQTNNIAELSAIELAVVFARDNFEDAKLTIVTDSQYCQGLITFDKIWGKWKYRAKKNTELVRRIRGALPPLHMLDVQWVKGHDGNWFNERADIVAKHCKESRGGWTARYPENMPPPSFT